MKKTGFLRCLVFGLFYLVLNASAKPNSLPPPPPPPFLKSQNKIAQTNLDGYNDASPDEIVDEISIPSKTNSKESASPALTLPKDMWESAPNTNIPHGENLVSINFPDGVNLSDIIKTIGVWADKNFVLPQGTMTNVKISIIAPEPMTKEEAYQTFLSALNISGFTTVETGKIVKILPIATSKSSNIKTYYGANWAPETDEIINQVIPLRFVDANSILNQLRPLLGVTQTVAFTPTNAIILTDTGFRIKSILEIIKLLDSKTEQAQVEIIPINYMDAKDANQKITEIFGSKYGPSIILQKSLVDERTNSLILIGPASGLDDIVKFIKRIDSPLGTESPHGMIRVRQLDYADAEKLAQTLQTFVQGQTKNTPQSPFFTGRFPPFPGDPNQNPNTGNTNQNAADLSNVKIASDKSTNSLIIQGNKTAYAELETLILALDKRKSQIYLEADILDLAVENGLEWRPSVIGGSSLNEKKFLMPFGFNPNNTAYFSIPQSGSSQDFQAALKGMGANFLLGILSNKTVDLGGFKVSPGALLFALKTDSNTNVLQTPSMMVSDNDTAKFNATAQYRTVVNVPNPNGLGTVGSPQTYDVTTELKVTPQISRADYINLKITLQLDDAGASDPQTGYPNPINKRMADSVVTVRSGQTAVMGGLTKESYKKQEAKIPLLGDIPILGWLFKIVNSAKVKSNLTLFLTPHVVKNSEDLAKIYEKKLRDRDEFLKMYYGKSFKKEDFYKHLPTPEQGKAIPDVSTTENINNKTESEKNLRTQNLPSKNNDPIVTPSQNSSGIVPSSQYSLPPPPPPPTQSIPQ